MYSIWELESVSGYYGNVKQYMYLSILGSRQELSALFEDMISIKELWKLWTVAINCRLQLDVMCSIWELWTVFGNGGAIYGTYGQYLGICA